MLRNYPAHALCVYACCVSQNVTKDRSLGTVEVKVSDLARKGEDEKLGYESVGKKSMRDRVNLGRGVYKGEIVYDCEFLPGVQLKGVEFQGAGNEVANKAMDGTADGDVAEDSGTQDPESEEAAQRHSRMAKPTVAATTDGGFKEKGVHHANPHKKGESIASMASIETAATAETSGTVPEAATGGVTMSRDELLATREYPPASPFFHTRSTTKAISLSVHRIRRARLQHPIRSTRAQERTSRSAL